MGGYTLCKPVNFMLNFFQNELAFNQSIKSFYLVLSVILGLLFYLIVCYFIKAFQMNDIKELLKHKEILEKLEKSVDYCEDVADVLRDIVTKYS